MQIILDSIYPSFHKSILNKYNIKLISSIDIENCFELEFEGDKKDLKKFYNKYFNTGESFEEITK
tara:strand:+ start:1246 stop:1440 length:195 start_codon:yes stop_codon:yes gene_type:complete